MFEMTSVTCSQIGGHFVEGLSCTREMLTSISFMHDDYFFKQGYERRMKKI